jgi:hypothetical protein
MMVSMKMAWQRDRMASCIARSRRLRMAFSYGDTVGLEIVETGATEIQEIHLEMIEAGNYGNFWLNGLKSPFQFLLKLTFHHCHPSNEYGPCELGSSRECWDGKFAKI